MPLSRPQRVFGYFATFGMQRLERVESGASAPSQSILNLLQCYAVLFQGGKHARKNVAGNVPRFSLFAIEASVFLNPCFFSRFANSA